MRLPTRKDRSPYFLMFAQNPCSEMSVETVKQWLTAAILVPAR